MKAKLFEVRDSMTFIPVLAVKLYGMLEEEPAEVFLQARAGFQHPGLVLCMLSTCKATSDPYDWQDRTMSGDPYDWQDRTMSVAHNYIQEHFETLATGSVVDVEYILGETDQLKRSEREEIKIIK